MSRIDTITFVKDAALANVAAEIAARVAARPTKTYKIRRAFSEEVPPNCRDMPSITVEFLGLTTSEARELLDTKIPDGFRETALHLIRAVEQPKEMERKGLKRAYLVMLGP